MQHRKQPPNKRSPCSTLSPRQKSGRVRQIHKVGFPTRSLIRISDIESAGFVFSSTHTAMKVPLPGEELQVFEILQAVGWPAIKYFTTPPNTNPKNGAWVSMLGCTDHITMSTIRMNSCRVGRGRVWIILCGGEMVCYSGMGDLEQSVCAAPSSDSTKH